MSLTETNKEIVIRLYEEGINKRNFALLDEIISDDYTGSNGLKGVDNFKVPINGLIKAFPDLKYNIEEVIAEDNKVVVKWQLTGTHQDTFQNIEKTGKAISNNGMAIHYLKDNKLVNAYVHTDRFNFLQDLGVISADLLVPNRK